MADSEQNLQPKKDAAIIALVTAKNIEDAVTVADVPIRTLYRWLKETEFDKAYRVAKRSAFGQATSRLQQGSAAAAMIMLKMMVDLSVPASIRVKAADYVYGHAKNAIEIEEIGARVAALERASEERKSGSR